MSYNQLGVRAGALHQFVVVEKRRGTRIDAAAVRLRRRARPTHNARTARAPARARTSATVRTTLRYLRSLNFRQALEPRTFRDRVRRTDPRRTRHRRLGRAAAAAL